MSPPSMISLQNKNNSLIDSSRRVEEKENNSQIENYLKSFVLLLRLDKLDSKAALCNGPLQKSGLFP